MRLKIAVNKIKIWGRRKKIKCKKMAMGRRSGGGKGVRVEDVSVAFAGDEQLFKQKRKDAHRPRMKEVDVCM